MIGWSGAIVPPVYVRSSSVASTVTLQRGNRGMRGILDLNRRVLNIGMPVEIGPDQGPVERPVVFRVGGRMNADEAASPADIPLERGFLRRVQHVAGGGEKHDRLVLGERFVREHSRVLGRVDRKSTRAALLADSVDAGRD